MTSSLSTIPSPSQPPSIEILQWVALVTDVLNLSWGWIQTFDYFGWFVWGDRKWKQSAGTQMLCFLAFRVYLILFFVCLFFLPTKLQFRFVVLFFSDVYQNGYFHGLVEYIWFSLVPHYSHHHRYFKSCCFDWKKNIWSKINTIIVQACLVFPRAEVAVDEGQYCFRATGVRLPLWDLYFIHGSKRQKGLIHEMTLETTSWATETTEFLSALF